MSTQQLFQVMTYSVPQVSSLLVQAWQKSGLQVVLKDVLRLR